MAVTSGLLLLNSSRPAYELFDMHVAIFSNRLVSNVSVEHIFYKLDKELIVLLSILVTFGGVHLSNLR